MPGTRNVPVEGALIALGANLAEGDRSPRETLEAALLALEEDGFAVKARSRWWRSPAFPPGSGPDFVNGAARIVGSRGDVDAETVLKALHRVERSLGRERRARWAPRVCDLDLLAIGSRVLPDPETLGDWMALTAEEAGERLPATLLLPHPRLHERGFVLAPLAEVARDWRHPLTLQTVGEMLEALPETALDGLQPIDA
ncbi:MAG: 2-amino-4-hydroxy-6-hydroxymethyldihydropteridine diphosphokinase [Pseudomonadota bacterium]